MNIRCHPRQSTSQYTVHGPARVYLGEDLQPGHRLEDPLLAGEQITAAVVGPEGGSKCSPRVICSLAPSNPP